jgi:multiple sugar transport system substrate-binding protein
MKQFNRRRFLKFSAALSLGPFLRIPGRAAQPKTLSILQWSHFVPAFDQWFDHDFCKAWGEKHGVAVTVDHITVAELPRRVAAEASARKGHDLVLMNSPPAAFEALVIDHGDIYKEVRKHQGNPLDLALKCTFNPVSGKHFAFSPSYTPVLGNFRTDLFQQAGLPNGPDNWDELRAVVRGIREKNGNPCGLGLSQEEDSNCVLRALLWSFGAAESDGHGQVTINSPKTIEALKFMRALHKESQSDEVFSWDAASNNKAMLGGRASYVFNGVSIARTAEKQNPDMVAKIGLCRPLAGPAARLAPPQPASCYVIWQFSPNKDQAQQFLIDYAAVSSAAFRASEFYNLPCFPDSVPGMMAQLANDPKTVPHDKYKALGQAAACTTNIGYPGYATPWADEVFRTFVIPTMFAKVAKDKSSPEEAAKEAEAEIHRIMQRSR